MNKNLYNKKSIDKTINHKTFNANSLNHNSNAGNPKHILTVIKDNQTFSLPCEESDTVLRVLQQHGFLFRASCGGKGTCGHCLVLADGVKKRACQLLAKDCQSVTLLSDMLNPEVEVLPTNISSVKEDLPPRYGIAVDIGTTTIALALAELNSGSILSTHGYLNPGASYGADVLSRIEASNQGHCLELQQGLLSSLYREILNLIQNLPLLNQLSDPSFSSNANLLSDTPQILPSCTQIESICIAANTAMCHLLLGLSCETLGRAPFRPVTLSYPPMSGSEFFADAEPPLSPMLQDSAVMILPGLSAFIGGDITSGLYTLPAPKDSSYFLFVDLGTNGEMILGNQECLFGTSVAAGPAFEGSRVPGSEVLSALCEIQKKKALDETGLLRGAYFYGGYRYGNYHFSQEDIRSIQLAKASVRAGIETLIHTAQITASQISAVYLCGGFGTHTDTDQAIAIGMFPEEFRGKVSSMGNTSLGGAVRYLTTPSASFFDELQKRTRVVDLASSEVYQDAYVRWMGF